jgi:hypothetical protein
MSRELDLLAKEFSKKPCTVLRKNISLYEKNLLQEMADFSRGVEKEAKKTKQGNLTVISVLSE